MIAELINHLWQSTLFVAGAGLLAVILRRNGAQVRYGLWLIASLKFLVPFSLLIGVGSQFAWQPAANSFAAQIATPTVSHTVEQITQPFSLVLTSSSAIPATGIGPTAQVWFFAGSFSIWMCGLAAITFARLQMWRRIRAAVRASTPLEIPTIATWMQIRSCPGLLEPAVVGLVHQRLLLPAGILGRLTKDQLKAVIGHELCHGRRRDNLTAGLHMIVEAAFWFHPLVWWIGARLVEERERACDEEVLRLGSEPRVYAEGILNVCKFYRESPLVCMSGVTGSNLKKRVEDIMRNRVVSNLSFSRMVLLVVAAVIAVSAPVAVGAVHAMRVEALPVLQVALLQSRASQAPKEKRLEFEVTSIRPTSSQIDPKLDIGLQVGGTQVRATYLSIKDLVGIAYPVRFDQIFGPDWIASDRFDIAAKLPAGSTRDQVPQMLQRLLEDRFQMKLHREKKESAVYSLRVDKSGLKVKELPPDPDAELKPNGALSVMPGGASINYGRGSVFLFSDNKLESRQLTMPLLTETLSHFIDHPVVDLTNLKGRYDFVLNLSPEDFRAMMIQSSLSAGVPLQDQVLRLLEGASYRSLFDAFQKSGLRLQSEKLPLDVLVIDSIQRKPTDN